VTELPDFTDCSFATREPDADWFAIVHDGGPVRGFVRMMPAFGEALSASEVQAALDRVRAFCSDPSWPRGELNLPRPLFTEKAYPEDEAVFTIEDFETVSTKFVYEKRFGSRNQLEVAVPVAESAGVPDVAIGIKRALMHSLVRGSIVSVAGEIIVPAGENHATAVFEPFLAYGQILPHDAFLHAQLGAEFPFDLDRAEREGFVRLAAGRSFVEGMFGRTWSPMVEVLGSGELESNAAVHWDVVPQFQVTLNRRQHIMANIGVRVPLDDRDVRDARVVVYLLWDWFDGGLLDGW
jgi:hypothetical protein